MGVVVRDFNGQAVAALCLSLQSYFFAELTEVFALEQGVLFAQELQLPWLSLNLMLWQLFKQLMIKLRGACMVTLFREFYRFVSHLSLAISSI